MRHSAQPTMSFVTCCVLVPSLAQAKCSLCTIGVGWDWGRSSAGAEPFVCFLLTSTILKPLTMPNIPISEVDALPESDQTSSPTGTCMVGGSSSLGLTVWRLIWWMLYTVTYFLKTKFTWFKIQNLLKRIESFPSHPPTEFPSVEANWRHSSQGTLCKHREIHTNKA